MKLRNRNLGVNEARLGLSMLTVVSLVLGYVALQRLGGTGEAPPVEIRRTDAPTTAGGATVNASDDPATLQMLKAQEGDLQDVPLMSRRPAWDSQTISESGAEFDLNGSDSLWSGAAESIGEFGRLPSGPAR